MAFKCQEPMYNFWVSPVCSNEWLPIIFVAMIATAAVAVLFLFALYTMYQNAALKSLYRSRLSKKKEKQQRPDEDDFD